MDSQQVFADLRRSAPQHLKMLAVEQQHQFAINPELKADVQERLASCRSLADRHYAVVFMLYLIEKGSLQDFGGVVKCLGDWMLTTPVLCDGGDRFQLDTLLLIENLSPSSKDFQKLQLWEGALHLKQTGKAEVRKAADKLLQQYSSCAANTHRKHSRYVVQLLCLVH